MDDKQINELAELVKMPNYFEQVSPEELANDVLALINHTTSERIKIRAEAVEDAAKTLMNDGLGADIEEEEGYEPGTYSMAHFKFLQAFAKMIREGDLAEPIVENVRLHIGRCPRCGETVSAAARKTPREAADDVRSHMRIVHEGE